MQKLIIFSLLCGLSTLLHALPKDNQATIHISADSSLFNYKTGANTFEGNVKIDQGSTHFTADRVITKNNLQHKIEEAIAYGVNNYAEYSTIPKEGDAVFQAKAKIIKYYPPKGTIILENDVTITQGENSFQGPIIIYNMKDQTVDAPASKNGRATMLINTKQLTS